MTLPLATSLTVLSHGGHAVRLRPSLRAATLLQASHGIGRLVRDLTAGTLSTVLAIVDATADDPIAARALILDVIAERGIISLLSLTDQLEHVVMDSFGIDPNTEHVAERNERVTGRPFDMAKALADLFEIGTGWLQWSPADTWSATPAEIMAAHRGLVAKLRAIHGSNDEQERPSYDPGAEISPDELQASLSKLRSIAAESRAR